MSNSRLLSIVALYNWDNDIFDDIIPYLPTQVSDPEISITPEPLDSEVLIGNILFACGELSIIYNDPKIFKFYLKIWAQKNKDIWQRLFDSMYYKYDPLFSRVREYHLDRTQSLDRATKDDHTESSTYGRSITDDDLVNVTENHSHLQEDAQTRTLNTQRATTDSQTSTDEAYKQAFNNIGAAYWSPDTKNDSTSSGSGSQTDTGTIGDSGRSDYSGTDSQLTTRDYSRVIADTAAKTLSKNGTLTDEGKLADIITEKITGQRAYQELIELQRRLAMFSLYDFIIDQFKGEFCLMIY